jgi:hypothetical protein
MKLLTLRVNREFHPAVVTGDDVLDLVLADAGAACRWA